MKNRSSTSFEGIEMTKIKSLIALVIIAFALTGCDMINGKKDVEVDPPAASASQVQNAIEWAQYAVKVAKSASAAAATADAKAEDAMSVAQAASAAASKCSSKCGGGKPVTPKKPYGQTKPKKPVTPAVIPAPAPTTPVVVATPPAPAASAPCTTCKLVAKEEAVTPAENGMCSITVIEHDTRKVLGFIHVTKHETSGRIMVTRVRELKFIPHGDNSANVIGTPKWTPFTSPGTCSGDRAQIYAAWGDAIKMLGFPEKCTWFMPSKT